MNEASTFSRNIAHAVIELLETRRFAMETRCHPIDVRIKAGAQAISFCKRVMR